MGKKKKADTKKASKRKALEAREAEIAAELARREKKDAKKAKKKADAKREAHAKAQKKTAKLKHPEKIERMPDIVDADALGTMTIGVDGETPDPEPGDFEPRSKPVPPGKMKEAVQADTDAAIKRRVAEKRAARERDERLAQLQKDVASDRAERVAKAKTAQVAEVVETESGREIAVGSPSSDEIAKPSEAPKTDFEVNGNGQYKVKRPSDGKLVGYTRVTTYIAALEDTSMLTKWKMRLLLEGVAAADDPAARESVTGRIRELAHVRDVTIAKARKHDRKGKLHAGQLATITEGAWGDFKRAMDALADELFELGGGREAAAKGTDIHALCDLHDSEGMQAVADLLSAGQITPADLADVEAYAAAIRTLGAEIIDSERVVVNDDLKVAGRLDRTVMVALPEIKDPKTGEVIRPAEKNRRRRVLDIKTGRVDYGTAKIAQQIGMYAGCVGYDLDTHERTPLRLDQTTGLLLHLPAGSAKATVHVVDLTLGRKGNRLAGDVRAFRNEGKRAIDLKTDVLDVITKAADE